MADLDRLLPSKRGLWLVVALLAVGVIATSPFWLFLLRAKTQVAAHPPLKLIAVLPFEQAIEGGSQEISDRITETIIRKISQSSKLEAVPFSQIEKFKNQKDLHLIGLQLGADYLVAGRAGFSGNKAYIQLYMVSAPRPWLPIWMNWYEAPVQITPAGTGNISAPMIDKIAGDIQTAALKALR